MRIMFRALLCLALAAPVSAQTETYPAPVEHDFIAHDVTFESGGSLPEVRLHYRTVGTPRKDARGVVRNGVLILHGTGGTGGQFLTPGYAGLLFGKGQILDAERYFIILPDNVGHGQSSKPSDGLRMKFPRYGYIDMVRLQHRLVTEGLGLTHLRLVMGTSMGGMQTWMWGYMYPGFVDGLVPLASRPAPITGRNRMWRKALMDCIRNDPTWQDGNYTTEPRGLADAMGFLLIAVSSPLQWQKMMPTGQAADEWLAAQVKRRAAATDANDMLYYFQASEDYNPTPHLGEITAPLMAINSADDFVNPPEMPMMEQYISRVKHGRYVLVPISDKTWGHSTHSHPEVWGSYLKAFLESLPPMP